MTLRKIETVLSFCRVLYSVPKEWFGGPETPAKHMAMGLKGYLQTFRYPVSKRKKSENLWFPLGFSFSPKPHQTPNHPGSPALWVWVWAWAWADRFRAGHNGKSLRCLGKTLSSVFFFGSGVCQNWCTCWTKHAELKRPFIYRFLCFFGGFFWCCLFQALNLVKAFR